MVRDDDITRRELLKTVGATTAGLVAWSALPRLAHAQPTATVRRRALRIAHLADIHVQPELRAGDGMTACLRHVQQLADTPDLILTGGDSVMDSFAADDARTRLQWDLWHRILKTECSLPIRSCIGNHDIWGWDKSKSRTTGDEPLWGKQRAVEMLHLDHRYYTFPQAGWQFIVLDSVRPHGDSYTAHLDDQQYDWLERTLRDTPPQTPVLILSHVPILSTTPLILVKDEHGESRVGSYLLHTDRIKLKDLFARHPNVKLCLSGHTHLLDRVDYNGVTYSVRRRRMRQLVEGPLQGLRRGLCRSEPVRRRVVRRRVRQVRLEGRRVTSPS